MLELFVVRHGESVRNLASQLAHQGYTSVLQDQLLECSDEHEWPLTEKGRVQALLAGKWLAEQSNGFEAIYCSPYLRAKQTAAALNLQAPITYDMRLREREWGTYPIGEYSVSEYLKDLTCCQGFDWKSRFMGSESVHDLVPSTDAFLRDLRAQHSSGQIVVVTHGGRMWALEQFLEGAIPPRRYTNCSVLRYRINDDSTEVRVDYPASTVLESLPWQPIRPTAAV